MIGRSFYISLAVAGLMLFSGGLLFHDSEGPMLAVQIASFAVGVWLLHRLDDQHKHNRKEG